MDMKLRQRLEEDNGVSPVIGVILMVAITVILAAVIASFVLNLSPDTAATPTASFSAEYNSSGSDNLVITMDSGEELDKGKVSVKGGDVTGGGDWPDQKISAGDSLTVDPADTDYKVTLIYKNQDTSSTLQTFEA